MLDAPSITHVPSAHPALSRAPASGRRDGAGELDGDVIAMLVRTEWLCERDAADRRAIGRAISKLLVNTCEKIL